MFARNGQGVHAGLKFFLLIREREIERETNSFEFNTSCAARPVSDRVIVVAGVACSRGQRRQSGTVWTVGGPPLPPASVCGPFNTVQTDRERERNEETLHRAALEMSKRGLGKVRAPVKRDNSPTCLDEATEDGAAVASFLFFFPFPLRFAVSASCVAAYTEHRHPISNPDGER